MCSVQSCWRPCDRFVPEVEVRRGRTGLVWSGAFQSQHDHATSTTSKILTGASFVILDAISLHV